MRRPVLVAHDFFRIEIVDALILRCVAAECETLADVLQHGYEVAREIAAEYRRLGRAVVRECARLGTDLDDLALLDNDHALPIVYSDAGAVADDVVRRARVGAAPTDAFLSLCDERVLVEAVAVEEFLPLISEDAADRADGSLDEAHKSSSYSG